MSVELQELISTIKEDKHANKKELAEMRTAIKEMSNNFSEYWKHVALWEEERKHDAEFKKEVRTFMKDSTPILLKAKDAQEKRDKWIIALGTFLMLGVLGAFFKF
jgi:ribosomal protein S20